MSTNCSSYWDIDDFTRCGKHLYLEEYLYGTALVVSLAVLGYKTISYDAGNDRFKLNGPPSPEEEPLISNDNSHSGYLTMEDLANDEAASSSEDTSSSDSNPRKETEILTASQKHFDVTRIRPVKEDGTPLGYIKFVFRNGREKLKVVIEELLLVAHVGLELTPFFAKSVGEEWAGFEAVPYFNIAYWVYLLTICTVRLAHVSTGFGYKIPDLWYYTFILYLVDWFPSFFLFRSALLNNIETPQAKLFYIIQFILDSALVLVAGSCRFSDRPAIRLQQDNIVPSTEMEAPFFSIITYAWIDKMVFIARKKAISMVDIWGLRFDDYAYPVLMKYHKTKRFYKFTYDLFNQFKMYLFLQACLTSVDGLIVFIPSILLKRILEYVDSPDTVSGSLAWMFVLLMFFSSAASAVFSGRGLYLGRRVCTRMKAIIIGEIYAKALRRRLTADDNNDNTENEAVVELDGHPDGLKNENEDEPQHRQKTEKDPSVMKSKDMGSIINLMAVDAFRVSEICAYLHYFVNSVVMTIFAIYLLYNLLGWPALAGAVAIFLMLPFNYWLFALLASYQKQMLKVTDKRIQKLNETFQNIRIIKFFSWEDKFEDDIMDIRMAELECLRKRCIAWVGSSFIWMVTPTVVCLVAFYCYSVILEKPLTTPIAFTALALFNLLRTPLDQFADMMADVMQSKVSLERIETFLNEPECSKYEQLSVKRGPNSPLVGFENATFSWSSHSQNDFKLRDINVSFRIGKLNVIVGSTGSGKSSLLLALLGEMDLVSGKVFLPGATPRDELVANPVTGLTESVAYCSQTPWLLNGTIKENILFAAPYDRERYHAVIEACGLKRDLEILNAGDGTEIGEKGVTLSGGQKQRVSLARALYSAASYVLLDDCLSAVDSHTAVHIYEECITGHLMKNRTCILVSHNISLTIKEAAWVIVMDNGRVKTQGDVDQLMEEDEFDNETVNSVMASRSNSCANLTKLDDYDHGRSAMRSQLLSNTVTALAAERGGEAIGENRNADGEGESPVEDIDEDDLGDATAGKLMKEESKSEGAVSLSVYKTYFEFFGTKTTRAWLIFAFIGAQVVYVLQSWWLRIWSMAESEDISLMTAFQTTLRHAGDSAMRMALSVDWNRPLFNTVLSAHIYGTNPHSTMYYIFIYTLIGVLYSLLGSMRIIITFFSNLRVSREIFRSMLDRIVRAKIRFFDSTPIGRIMNRFSKDIEGVDQELAPYAEAAVVTFISCLATVIVISLITPVFIIFAIIIMYLYLQVGILYLNLSRDLKRYESITRSPIHQHFSETLVGVTTIRAYCDESRFLVQNMERIDNNNRPFFYVWLNNRWLAFRADMIGSMITFLSAALAVVSAGHIDSGMAGISLSFAVSFNNAAVWLLRTYSNVEINMNSVERIQEYIEHTEQEPPAHSDHDPPASWPERGEIEVSNLSIRYAPELPRVIDQISFHVNAAEKIGVVGRTGAGKSTIIQSFFRFVDPDSGFIKIDGFNICEIGLGPLRRGLTIIPQDPTLFAGTLRSNLDIYSEYSDIEMFESLRRVNLISNEEYTESVNANRLITENDTLNSQENANKFLNLDSAITEGGGNLSQGERQLVCLSRSLLKEPRILMLDEATASIDYESDTKLQKTIRDEFSQSTIITIAHRLKTIIDYDRILVLDAGKIKEFDSPYKLIQNKKSQFRSMCLDTGEFDELVRISRQAYRRSQTKR
ncbi:DEKNAAC105626 [Brettanomyces naardenensis]|uniref:DEKNAAC105626 n=1 Tax=Brettanomyces naardenensis TaxID=13370 RepID=A0A448YU51_BRENA|nr:DEKNAAC105626 [Brettanomyces naardenensis]